ncbi:COX15/CtaA family protein [Chromobacterium subtsugae]|uniref:COX15/CtaA family protein n=1 Tax=Chromobacterium subtsugae TaxID=251747 RepID=A0ABS7FEB4_9NEIS|nr:MULTISPECIES: COX15/CtaA family protein [Chromobacterium]KUM03850.1 cytochrome C oxidase subunit I [Chromobacterium subtsugae]KZE87489.1 cytochrome C oxidase subunit I [Chromobacterium sp. F49]MBW7566639.1 COX15/CtaA family protein [Chromobacterium subtsugae]MBW8288326.1 COX15/CtaA family protein [Chromobacterium subtsugae]OBU87228.1 cytochrome c oxidase subunit I [Chromobacterium subtsugae]
MRKLVWLALLLAAVVVPFGAYVRLSHAGLGCPDWPGCYGQLSPSHAALAIQQAQALAPDGPVSLDKAWKEMLHRYLAGSLGALIVLIAWQAWRTGRQRLPAALLLGVVLTQGLLGMLTVTLLLKPAIVTSHLLGGMGVLQILAWMAASPRLAAVTAPPLLGRLSGLLASALALQLALGGWVSSNYAALACQGFPGCNGDAWPALRFDHAFHLLRELGEAPDGSLLDFASLVTIHWLHRLGALLVSLLLLSVLALGWRLPPLRRHLAWLAAAWLLQVGLGIANVLLQLPLPLAVAHNAGAALLLMAALLLLSRLRPRAAELRPAARVTPAVMTGVTRPGEGR